MALLLDGEAGEADVETLLLCVVRQSACCPVLALQCLQACLELVWRVPAHALRHSRLSTVC